MGRNKFISNLNIPIAFNYLIITRWKITILTNIMFLTSYILHLKSRTIFYIPYTIFLLFLFLFPPSASAQTTADWYMSAANPQRTSWASSEVRGPFKPVWYRPIDPYIDNKVQAIAANGSIYVATAKGLYAFDAASGNQRWVYGTELPLGNSPTYYNGT